MKLLNDLIARRLELSKDLELNNNNLKSIWHFYEVYKLCLNFSGKIDPTMKLKNKLIRRLITNPENIFVLGKLKRFISEDVNIIELTLNSLEESSGIGEVFEDFYPQSFFAINLDDRNL